MFVCPSSSTQADPVLEAISSEWKSGGTIKNQWYQHWMGLTTAPTSTVKIMNYNNVKLDVRCWENKKFISSFIHTYLEHPAKDRLEEQLVHFADP